MSTIDPNSNSNSSTTSSSTTNPPSSYQRKSITETMTPEERLASLRAYAEEKKYVVPGTNGTMTMGIGGDLQGGLITSGFEDYPPATDMRGSTGSGGGEGLGGDRWKGQYEGVVGPPSYGKVVKEDEKGKEKEKGRKGSVVRSLFGRRKNEEGEEAPAYKP